jgi:glutathione S-transferase
MTLKLWGRISSLNVRKVMWVAQRLELPIERVDAGLAFGVVKTPEYQAMNPNSLVPVLQDADLTLWESNVIVRYLCEKHSLGQLYPQEAKQRFVAEQWMDWQQAELNRSSGVPFLQAYRTAPELRNQNLIDEHVRKVEAMLHIANAQLGRTEYLAGDQLSMADVALLSEVHRWWGVREKLGLPQAYPHLERWAAPLLAHKASRGVYDIALS